MALSPITLYMVGLVFALWGNALANVGVDAKPHDEAGPDEIRYSQESRRPRTFLSIAHL